MPGERRRGFPLFPVNPLDAIQAFIERGGDVLYLVFAGTLFMWTLIL